MPSHQADINLFMRFANEAWNQGKIDVTYEVFSDNYIAHASDPAHNVRGAKEHAEFVKTFRAAFPDVHIDLIQIFAEGDTLVAHMAWSGTHKGDYQGLAATNRYVSVPVLGINRFENGKVVEAWGVVDMLSMLMQLGVIPVPEGGGPQMPPPVEVLPADAPKDRLSLEANKAIARRYVEEVWNKAHLDLIPELFADSYTIHTMGMDMPAPPAMLEMGITGARTTFPDFHMNIQHMIAYEDRVCVHWVNTGTQDGEFRTPDMEQGYPPSGNKVEFHEIAIFRIAQGKIAESWIVADQVTMLQQIGLAERPPVEG